MPESPAAIRAGIERLMIHDLRSSFRRVIWVGEPANRLAPAGRPTVLYANHNYFHDGHLLWLVVNRVLRRKTIIWMEQWDRTPIFSPVGAMPFPSGDVGRRLGAIRQTARILREDPDFVLIYFPQGKIHPPEAPVAGFPQGVLERMARVFPESVQWLPVGIRVTWTGHGTPVALLAGEPAHDRIDGTEASRITRTVGTLNRAVVDIEDSTTLLEGARDDAERWDLSVLRNLFHRWIPG